MNEKNTKEKIKKIISIIVNSKDCYSDSKIIDKDDYCKLCGLLGVTNIAETIKDHKSIMEAYKALVKIIDSYPEIFSIYNITADIGSGPFKKLVDYESYYGDKLIIFEF
jgi:hypothetical protein